jgi:arylsulfatase A-like enzyme
MTNVVLLTIDCLRADHMGCYGYKRNTTPFLDTLAEKGLFCEYAFANGPNTRHSVPSFLSSTYPLLFLNEVQSQRFHPGRTSAAEIYKKNGYATAAIHSNPYISRYYGYDRGFDYFNDFLLGQVEDELPRNAISRFVHELIKGLKAVMIGQLPHEDGYTINNAAMEWLNSIDTPFFLWLHYMDVHMPYVPTNESLAELGLPSSSRMRKIWLGRKIDDVKLREEIKDSAVPEYINLYDGCIRDTDTILEQCITSIEKKYPDTLFVITADHGEEFHEHTGLSHLEKLYDELLHVPLIFYGSNIRPKKMKKLFSLVDLIPSILDMLDIKISDTLQGVSLKKSREYIIAEAFKENRITAYRDMEWKFITSDASKELYNLKKDPLEKQNIAGNKDFSNKIDEFSEIINQYISGINRERTIRETMVHKQQIKQSVGRLKKI